MYMVSQPKALSDDQNKKLAQEEVTAYPPGYLLFLQRFGEGNYRGWMNVHLPDTEVLKPFAEYDLWEHDADSPITQEQIELPENKEELDALESQIRNQIDASSNSQQMDMLRLQSLSNKRNEAFDTMSNFIKKMQDSRSSIIGNMR